MHDHQVAIFDLWNDVPEAQAMRRRIDQLGALDQCRWLREIGFQDVDCFWKYFELAIFGGVK